MQPYHHRGRWVVIGAAVAYVLFAALAKGKSVTMNVAMTSMVLVLAAVAASAAANSMRREPGPGYMFIGTTFLILAMNAFVQLILYSAWLAGDLPNPDLCARLVIACRLHTALAYAQIPSTNSLGIGRARAQAVGTAAASLLIAALLRTDGAGVADEWINVRTPFAIAFGLSSAILYAITLAWVSVSARVEPWLRSGMAFVGLPALVSSVAFMFESRSWLVDFLGHYAFLATYAMTYIYILNRVDSIEQLAIKRALERYATEQKRLMLRLSTAREDEQRRLSHALHDDIGQMLSLVAGTLSPDHGGSSTGKDRMLRARELALKTLEAVRRIAREMRPAVLDDIGLIAALRTYVTEFMAAHAIDVRLQIVGPEGRRFPSEVETIVYRGVLEALTNAAKHSGASHISIVLDTQGTLLSALVEDNGRGFERRAGGPGMGLAAMAERLTLLGGTLVVESAPGTGTTVALRIPLASDGVGALDPTD